MQKKIYIFSPSLEKNKTGWSRFVLNIAEDLKDIFNIQVITCKGEVVTNKDYHVIELPLKYRDNHFTLSIISILYVLFILFKMKKFSNIFFPNFYFYFIPLILIKKIKQNNYYVRICGSELDRSKHRKFNIRLLKKVNKIIILNNNLYTKLLKLGINNIRYIPNYIDVKLFKNNFKKDYTYKHSINLLFVGNIVKEKGIYELIVAISELHHKHNIELDLIGDYTIQPKFLSRIKIKSSRNNLNINILGKLSKANLINSYPKYDLFVFPSYSEGMSNVVLEAMASGLPILATNIPGINDNISHGETGFLFNKNNFNKLSEYLNYLIINENLRKSLGRNSHKFTMNNRDKNSIIAKYISLFNEN